MFEVIKSIVDEHLDIEDSSQITLQSKLEDFDVDSLDIAEIIMALEDEFDIEINDEDVENLTTIEDIVDYISEKENS